MAAKANNLTVQNPVQVIAVTLILLAAVFGVSFYLPTVYTIVVLLATLAWFNAWALRGFTEPSVPDRRSTVLDTSAVVVCTIGASPATVMVSCTVERRIVKLISAR